MNVFDMVKRRLFPNIKDWSLDYPEIKLRPDYWKIPTLQFIVFHPLGTKWFLFGISAVGSIFFGLIAFYVFFYRQTLWIISALFAFVALVLLKSAIVKLMSWKVSINYTFYDMFFKETK